jgi:predicted anti-sigma-YlaC factor YlaD
MRCDDIRLAVSALMDNEALPDGLEPGSVERHLAGCAACRAWRDRALKFTRAVRLRPVEVPDLTATILAAARADGVAGRADPHP